MQYFDEAAGGALKDAFDALVGDWPSVDERTMFGCPSYRADGTLFAVVVTDGVALTRLPADRRQELEAVGEFDTGPFRAGDRTVTKWVQVTVADPDDVDALSSFVRASYEAALAE